MAEGPVADLAEQLEFLRANAHSLRDAVVQARDGGHQLAAEDLLKIGQMQQAAQDLARQARYHGLERGHLPEDVQERFRWAARDLRESTGPVGDAAIDPSGGGGSLDQMLDDMGNDADNLAGMVRQSIPFEPPPPPVGPPPSPFPDDGVGIGPPPPPDDPLGLGGSGTGVAPETESAVTAEGPPADHPLRPGGWGAGAGSGLGRNWTDAAVPDPSPGRDAAGAGVDWSVVAAPQGPPPSPFDEHAGGDAAGAGVDSGVGAAPEGPPPSPFDVDLTDDRFASELDMGATLEPVSELDLAEPPPEAAPSE